MTPADTRPGRRFADVRRRSRRGAGRRDRADGDRDRLLRLPDLHRRLQPAAEPWWCARSMSASCCCCRSCASGDRRADGRGACPSRLAARRSSASPLGLYHWVFEADLIQRAGDPTTTDLVVGTIAVVLVFEAARRDHGPGAAGHLRGCSWPTGCSASTCRAARATARSTTTRSSNQLSFGTEGIYGIADLRLVDLHLPVHPVRRVPRTGRA